MAVESLEEYQPHLFIPETVLAERRKPKQPTILNPRVLSFSEHADFFREMFQSSPDSIFRAYNPSPTFTTSRGGLYMAVRVDCGEMTKSVIFEHTANGLKPLERTFDLEDPLAENFGNEIVFGGVQVDKSFDNLGRVVSRWRTILYRGDDIAHLEPFFTGPEGMKDIRLHKRISDDKIDVYTRPRNPSNEALGGNGQIGYRVVESLDELASSDPSILDIKNAPLLPFRFKKGHWGGVNDVEDIKEGKYQGWNLLTIHDGSEDSDNLLNYPTGFLLHNTETGEVKESDTWITRDMLLEGPAKSNREKKVVFVSETTVIGNILHIRAGVSDGHIQEFDTPMIEELTA